MTTGKTTALTRRSFVGKVMSLLLNMLSRLVISFLPRSKCLLISWLQLPSAVILEPPKIKSDTVSPSISHLKFLYIRAYDFSSDACVGVLNCVQLFATPWTIACQASLSTEFSRQEYWSAWPCPPGHLPDPGIEPESPASPALAGRVFTTAPLGKPLSRGEELSNSQEFMGPKRQISLLKIWFIQRHM